MTGEKACYPVRLLCQVMRVSESAYHASASGKSYALSPHKAALAAQGSVECGTIIHTAQGSQHVSNNFSALLKEIGCRQSMSRRGNC